MVCRSNDRLLRDNKDLPDEKWKAVHYDKFVPILIEGMKEQQLQIEDLKAVQKQDQILKKKL